MPPPSKIATSLEVLVRSIGSRHYPSVIEPDDADENGDSMNQCKENGPGLIQGNRRVADDTGLRQQHRSLSPMRRSSNDSLDTAPKRPSKRAGLGNSGLHPVTGTPENSHKFRSGDDDGRVSDDRSASSATLSVKIGKPNALQRSTSQRSDPGSSKSVGSRRALLFQKSSNTRRQTSSRSLCTRRTIRRQDSMSIRSSGSRTSTKSIMSNTSFLELTTTVRSLLEMSADVVNSEQYEQTCKLYKKAIHAAGTEIMDINIQLRKMRGKSTSSNRAKQKQYHEDLRIIGIIIGLLRTKMAIVYGGENDFQRAIDLCKSATQVHKHQPALKGIKDDLQDADEVAGLMVLIIERLESAQQCMEDHIKLLDRMGLPTATEVEDDVSVCSAKEIIYDMVVARRTVKPTTGEKDETVALLSNHAVELDKHDAAIRYMRDALQIHMVALGMKHPDTGKCLMNIAKMYRGSGTDQKNESLVLGYYKHTAPIIYGVGMCPRARGSILNDMGVIHMRRQDFDEAIKFLLDALQCYETDATERESSVYYAQAMQVWRNLGECYMNQQLYNSAEGAFLEALDLQRESRRIQDVAEELQLDMIGVDRSVKNLINDTSIADTLCRIGKASAAGGDHQRALHVYNEAMTVINRDPANKDRPQRELLVQRDQLTHILYCVAEACSAIGDYDKAVRMYNLSIEIRNSGGAFSKDKRLRTKIHILRCFVGIGDTYTKAKDISKAEKQYREAFSYLLASGVNESHDIAGTIREKLEENGKIIDAASTRSPEIAELEKKADSEIERGALDQAIETLTHLLTLRRAALKQLKDAGLNTTEQVYAIACLLQTFGFVFAKNAEDENAERAFKDAAKLFKKIKPDTSFEV